MKPLITIDCRMITASGIGTYLTNLVPRLLVRLPEFRFVLLGNRIEIERLVTLDSGEVKVLDFDCPIYSVSEQLRLPRVIPRESALFWSPHFNFPIRYGGKLLVTVHDLFHLAMPHLAGSKPKRLAVQYLFKKIKDRADFVVFDSNFTRSEFSRLVGKERGGSEVVYCGIDSSWYSGATAVSRPKSKYIVAVGNIKPHKNLRLATEVILESKFAETYAFRLVGKSTGLRCGDAGVLELLESFPDRISATGFVTDWELRDHISNAACLVHPSLYEGFGLPPLEAMAAGTPVLASRAASIPEVCSDAALYFDPYDKAEFCAQLKRILEDELLRDELVAKGRERARQFSWEKSAGQLADILCRMINQPGMDPN